MDPINWERSLIGSCLLDQTKTPLDIKASDFSLPLHGDMWRVLQELAARGGLSVRSLTETMRDQDNLESLGGDETTRGEEYISELAQIGDIDTIDEFATQVKEASTKRILQLIGKELVTDARNGHTSDEIVEGVIKKLIKVQRNGAREARQIGEKIDELQDKYEKIRKGEALLPWAPKTQAVFDLFGHADESDFIIVVASPGSGKSSYLRHEAIEAALMGQGVLTITLENIREEAQSWAISKLSGINHRKITDPTKMSQREWELFKGAKESVKKLPWYVEDISFSDIGSIIKVARRMAVTKKLDLIQIDGMYLVEESAGDDGKYEVISNVAQGLRSLAQELHIPIMASTQFSRKVNTHKSPELGDLLYAGENPARGVWGMVKRPMTSGEAALFSENKDQEGRLLAEENWKAIVLGVKILKNTGGETGMTADFVWRKPTNRFESLEYGWNRKPGTFAQPGKPAATQSTFVSAPKPTREDRK